jgi:hypothetical protein
MKINLPHPSQLSPLQRALLLLFLIILLLTLIVTKGASQQPFIDKLAKSFIGRCPILNDNALAELYA